MDQLSQKILDKITQAMVRRVDLSVIEYEKKIEKKLRNSQVMKSELEQAIRKFDGENYVETDHSAYFTPYDVPNNMGCGFDDDIKQKLKSKHKLDKNYFRRFDPETRCQLSADILGRIIGNNISFKCEPTCDEGFETSYYLVSRIDKN